MSCNKEDFCLGLQKYVNFDDNYRGIKAQELMNLNTGEITDRLIVYYRLNKKDKGVCFNYCPYCGFELKSLRESEPVLAVLEGEKK